MFSTLVFCMVKLHYQANSYYPTSPTGLPLGSPLSFLHLSLSCGRLSLAQLSSVFSFILQPNFLNNLKVLYPLKRMDRSILRPPTSTLDCWAIPLNSAWGDYTFSPLLSPWLVLLCFPVTSFPPILLADIMITALSDLLCLGRLILFDRYLFSVVLPHLSGPLSCPCPSSPAWTFVVCLASPASHRGNVPIRGRARDALVASCCVSVG